jgi:hypothetical protein
MPFRICPECQHEREGNDEYGWCACDNPECPDYRLVGVSSDSCGSECQAPERHLQVVPELVSKDELYVAECARRHVSKEILLAVMAGDEQRIEKWTKELVTYNASISLAKELVKK